MKVEDITEVQLARTFKVFFSVIAPVQVMYSKIKSHFH